MTRHADSADATARLHDLARQRAEELRQQAVSDMVGELVQALDRAADHTTRAARRWSQRLKRHQRLRQDAPAAAADC